MFLLRLLFWVLHKLTSKIPRFGSILGLGVEFLWGREIDHFLPHKNCHTSTHPQPLHIPFPCPYLVPGSIAGFAKPNNKISVVEPLTIFHPSSSSTANPLHAVAALRMSIQHIYFSWQLTINWQDLAGLQVHRSMSVNKNHRPIFSPF